MVAIRAMKHNVSICSFIGDQVGAVKIAIDEADFRVLGCNLGAFVAVADKSGDLKIRIGASNSIEGVASDITCSAGTACGQF
jgi:DNA-binding FrmR family transcriptional regulator